MKIYGYSIFVKYVYCPQNTRHAFGLDREAEIRETALEEAPCTGCHGIVHHPVGAPSGPCITVRYASGNGA
jgi:hypothetical protein